MHIVALASPARRLIEVPLLALDAGQRHFDHGDGRVMAAGMAETVWLVRYQELMGLAGWFWLRPRMLLVRPESGGLPSPDDLCPG
jgi:hypothetical protein